MNLTFAVVTEKVKSVPGETLCFPIKHEVYVNISETWSSISHLRLCHFYITSNSLV